MTKTKKQRKEIKRTRLRNKKLLKRYPFLQMKNWWYKPIKTYDYTMLDDMPDGWRKCFGKEVLEEIREDLIRVNDLDRYQWMQVKEKYGTLRIYDNGTKIGSCVEDILAKYEYISSYTCLYCGRMNTPIINVGGWVIPVCQKCYKKINYTKTYDELTEDMTPDDMEIGLSYTTRMYKDNEWSEIEHDVSETVMKLLKKEEIYDKRRRRIHRRR